MLEKTEDSRFKTDLEFVRPLYFAKNMLLSVPKIALFINVSELKFVRPLSIVIFFLFGPKMHTFSSEYSSCQAVNCL